MVSDVPVNERLAVAEAQVATMGAAVVEIRDAIVGIRATLEHVARLDERISHATDSTRDLRRSLEAERDNRQTADTALSERLAAVERAIPKHEHQLSTAAAWKLGIGVTVIGVIAGYLAGVMI